VRSAVLGALCAAACALLCGCGEQAGGGHASVTLPPGAIPAGADPGVADPDAKLLTEPELTGNAKLFALTTRINTLCSGMPQLTTVKQPRAGDLEGQIEYAQVYFNVITTIDPTRPITDKQASSRGSRKRPLPDAVKQALVTERAEMYAYLVRLEYAHDLRDQGKNTPAETAQRIQDAFRTLATGAYADADLTLVRYEVDHCA
jgi:hypothetical protein